MTHIFYDTRNLTLLEKVELCNFTKQRCIEFRVDELDCSKSWTRNTIDMPYEDIIKLLSDKSHFFVIHRRGFENNGEIGFRESVGGIDYFLYLITTEETLTEVVNKFGLSKRG